MEALDCQFFFLAKLNVQARNSNIRVISLYIPVTTGIYKLITSIGVNLLENTSKLHKLNR